MERLITDDVMVISGKAFFIDEGLLGVHPRSLVFAVSHPKKMLLSDLSASLS